jgi:radical SAM superfamily enzyme YgiQ (UPF0313 family)
MQNPSPSIVLCTLNAKYIHASLGLRYLLANMGSLYSQTQLLELTINRNTTDLLQSVMQALGPAQTNKTQIIGFGVYIWNVIPTLALIQELRQHRPDLKIVLGGPEVSHETDQQEIIRLADYVITGWGDISFPKLCHNILSGPPALMKIIPGEQPALEAIQLPYNEYSTDDIAHRVVYVEASRGCPFKCEFCLSSLDKTAWAFDLELFLASMQDLYKKGVRQFKFVDRTFNLKIEASSQILQFFLNKLELEADKAAGLFVHFELIPDQLPDKLKDLIVKFPAGVLQFEIGIQSFNPEVQKRISRKQDDAKTKTNIQWLTQKSEAHLHTDLIFGLPGESLASFANGFDTLFSLKPHEIQLGVLKKLRGTPIARHTQEYGMVYENTAPYTVQQTSSVSRQEVVDFQRMARYWDLIANSGRFQQTLDFWLNASAVTSVFEAFWNWSLWLWKTSEKTSGLSPEAIVDYLYSYLTEQGFEPSTVKQYLLNDYLASGARAKPKVLADSLTRRLRQKINQDVNDTEVSTEATLLANANASMSKRQQMHLLGQASAEKMPS